MQLEAFMIIFTSILSFFSAVSAGILCFLCFRYVIPAQKASILRASLSDQEADPDTGRLFKVAIITRPDMLKDIIQAMNAIGVTGITVTNVMGCGVQKGALRKRKCFSLDASLLPKIKIEIAVSHVPVDLVIDSAKQVLHTGKAGDGKLFVYDIRNVVRIRTGEEGGQALRNTAKQQIPQSK